MSIKFWIIFNLFILGMLALDLFVFNRKEHVIKMKEALYWSGFWILLSLIFNVFIYFWLGEIKALEFLSGYLIEKSLSVDNLFVFLIIFLYFKVPREYQHKVLFWGILGALVMRGVFIFAGIAIIEKFHFTLYVLGVFLIYIGGKMAFQKDKEFNPEQNIIIKTLRKYLPLLNSFQGSKFWIKKGSTLYFTPLFIVLVVIETTDVVFAIDSVPAVLAISNDPFIVYSSNVFAILGLRALYFALEGSIQLFHYLKYGLALVLIFIGFKILVADWFKIDIGWALATVGLILISSVLLSVIIPKKPIW